MIGLRSFSIPRGSSDLLKIISALLVMFSHYFNLKAQAGFELNAFEWCIDHKGEMSVWQFSFSSRATDLCQAR